MVDFQKTREFFHIPEKLTYLCGNSLGPLPKGLPKNIASQITDGWGEMIIGGWNNAGWMELSSLIGNKIGRLIGAPEGTTIMGDTLSIKVYQALGAALKLNPGRKIILTDTDNFPSDIYVAQGLASFLRQGYEVKIVNRMDISDELNDMVAVLLLTEVDYKSGARLDMANLTQLAKSKGIITIWDLAHSVGAFPVNIQKVGADFAIGCTYKYLNGGPGAPAFIYVDPNLISQIQSPLAGWLGHAQPFQFSLEYDPAPSIRRMLVGTPPIIGLSALNYALGAWEGITVEDVHTKSMELSELFIEGVKSNCPGIKVISPENPMNRGSHVCLEHPEGYSIVRFLIENSVICDFREPNHLRFGIAPLYNGSHDIHRALEVLIKALEYKPWKYERHQTRNFVT